MSTGIGPSRLERKLTLYASSLKDNGETDLSEICLDAAGVIGELRNGMDKSIRDCESCINGKIEILEYPDDFSEGWGTGQYRDCPSCKPLMDALSRIDTPRPR